MRIRYGSNSSLSKEWRKSVLATLRTCFWSHKTHSNHSKSRNRPICALAPVSTSFTSKRFPKHYKPKEFSSKISTLSGSYSRLETTWKRNCPHKGARPSNSSPFGKKRKNITKKESEDLRKKKERRSSRFNSWASTNLGLKRPFKRKIEWKWNIRRLSTNSCVRDLSSMTRSKKTQKPLKSFNLSKVNLKHSTKISKNSQDRIAISKNNLHKCWYQAKRSTLYVWLRTNK